MSAWTSNATLFVSEAHLESERYMLINHLKGSFFSVEIIHCEIPAEIRDFDHEAKVPFLTDKGLYLRDTSRLDEFFEERYPGTPLLPIDPIARAKVRSLAA